MKTKILLAVTFLAVLSTIGISQDTKLTDDDRFEIVPDKPISEAEAYRILKLSNGIQSLYRVKAIWVLVEDLRENAKAEGLTEEQLKTDVELKLRLAGIKVNSEEESHASEDGAYLYVIITSVTNEYQFSYSVHLKFQQSVNLRRKPNLLIYGAATWNRSGVGLCGKNLFKESVRDILKDQVDTFLNDYLKANPKK